MDTNKMTDEWGSIEDPWDLIKSYFGDRYLEKLVKHQIEAFDDFTNVQIEKTIEMFCV